VPERCDGAFEVTGIARVERRQINPQRRRHRLEGAKLPTPRDGGITQDSGGEIEDLLVSRLRV
jgi:hypothetical protein